MKPLFNGTEELQYFRKQSSMVPNWFLYRRVFKPGWSMTIDSSSSCCSDGISIVRIVAIELRNAISRDSTFYRLSFWCGDSFDRLRK